VSLHLKLFFKHRAISTEELTEDELKAILIDWFEKEYGEVVIDIEVTGVTL